MTKEDFDIAMSYLDAIEIELNKIAEIVGHCSFEEFLGVKKGPKPLY